MYRKFLTFICFWFCFLTAFSKAGIVAKAPKEVGLEDKFKIIYSVSDLEADKLTAPQFGPNFKVVAGPMRSTSSSVQIINGDVSKSTTTSISYILQPLKKGKFDLPKTTLEADGVSYMSNDLSIIVVEGSVANSQAQQNDPFANFPFGGFPFGGMSPFSPFGGGQSVPSRQNVQRENEYKPEHAFLKMEVSKSNVYDNEVFVATLNLYTRYGFQGRLTQTPEMSGCLSEYVQVDPEKDSYETTIKDVKYNVSPLAKFVVTPTKTGKLKIGECKFESELIVNSFGQRVERTFVSNPVSINVKELPNKPENFSHAVGKFNVSSELIPASDFKTNEAVTLRLKISGSGNLKLISSPEIKFPSDFEVFTPKPTNDIKYTAKGESGERIIDYVFVPRTSGSYTIPAAEFVYFDLNEKKYKTLKTSNFNIEVKKGSSVSNSAEVNKKEVEVNKDINYIKTSKANLFDNSNYFVSTYKYILSLVIPVILFIAAIFGVRFYYKRNSNVLFVKHRKANKNALKRLKLAKKYMDEGQTNSFYEEVMHALWGYVSDKLSIPQSELNKENIRERLLSNNADEGVISSFINVLNDSEYARFAPNDESLKMDSIYERAVDIISEMEDCIGKK